MSRHPFIDETTFCWGAWCGRYAGVVLRSVTRRTWRHCISILLQPARDALSIDIIIIVTQEARPLEKELMSSALSSNYSTVWELMSHFNFQCDGRAHKAGAKVKLLLFFFFYNLTVNCFTLWTGVCTKDIYQLLSFFLNRDLKLSLCTFWWAL